MNDMITTTDWRVVAAMLVLILLLCISPDVAAWNDGRNNKNKRV